VSDAATIAALLGVSEDQVRLELNRAIRRSEPDAREVAGLIRGRRFVARRERDRTVWRLSLEERPARRPWGGWPSAQDTEK
jgi:hypothetical protein